MPSPLIALVEDEASLAHVLLFNLQAEGFRVHHEPDGRVALRWLLDAAEPPAAVLLDVMLPGQDGFSIVRALREAKRYIPVLLLTARGRTEDVVEGFTAGADDYLPKPFDLDVLLARLGSLLRRTQWGNTETASVLPSSPGGEATETVSVGTREIDFAALEIRGGPQTVHLTVMEADLLRYLLAKAGRIVSRKEILEEVWRVHSDTDTRPVDNFIVRLRRYLEPDPAKPVFLLTVRGVGYRFLREPAAALKG